MNIFILHKNPTDCAQSYCDQHVRKMILETAQLLSFAHHRFPVEGRELPFLYKYSKSHGEHPCAKWVYKSKANYEYLVSLGMALCLEYTYRFKKIHKTQAVMEGLLANIPALPDKPLTTFALAMPTQYHFISSIKDKTVFRDAIKSYRRYYRAEKQQFKRGPAIWTNREIPQWINPQ